MIEESSLSAVECVAEKLGHVAKVPMNFANGAMKIRRVSKIDPGVGDVLMLDLLLVTPELQRVWEERTRVEREQGSISVVSREGLITLKTFRSSGQDLDDIKRLQSES